MQEGVRGVGPNFEYLSAIKVSVKDKSRFQNRSMILLLTVGIVITGKGSR